MDRKKVINLLKPGRGNVFVFLLIFAFVAVNFLWGGIVDPSPINLPLLLLFWPLFVSSILTGYRGQEGIQYALASALGLLLTLFYWYLIACILVGLYKRKSFKTLFGGFLLILSASVILLYMDTLNNPAPGCSGFTELMPLDYAAYHSGYFLIAFKSGRSDISIPSGGVSVYMEHIGVCSGPESGVNYNVTGYPIINLTCPGFRNKKTGDTYRVDINITFTDSKSAVHHSNGVCRGSRVEP
jgi:hypothetical protein